MSKGSQANTSAYVEKGGHPPGTPEVGQEQKAGGHGKTFKKVGFRPRAQKKSHEGAKPGAGRSLSR